MSIDKIYSIAILEFERLSKICPKNAEESILLALEVSFITGYCMGIAGENLNMSVHDFMEKTRNKAKNGYIF
jgi:hypothetical protein